MALFKKDRREPVPPAQTDVHDTSVGTAADVEAVMKKYDRESNTRVWEGLPKLVIRWLMVASCWGPARNCCYVKTASVLAPFR